MDATGYRPCPERHAHRQHADRPGDGRRGSRRRPGGPGDRPRVLGNNFTVVGTAAGSTFIDWRPRRQRFDVNAIGGNTKVIGGAGNEASRWAAGQSIAERRQTHHRALMLAGGARPNSVAVTADVDFTLSNSSLQLSNGDSIGLGGITQASLTGGPSRQHVRRDRLDRYGAR